MTIVSYMENITIKTMTAFPPVALAFNHSLINDFMREWAYHFDKRQKGKYLLTSILSGN